MQKRTTHGGTFICSICAVDTYEGCFTSKDCHVARLCCWKQHVNALWWYEKASGLIIMYMAWTEHRCKKPSPSRFIVDLIRNTAKRSVYCNQCFAPLTDRLVVNCLRAGEDNAAVPGSRLPPLHEQRPTSVNLDIWHMPNLPQHFGMFLRRDRLLARVSRTHKFKGIPRGAKSVQAYKFSSMDRVALHAIDMRRSTRSQH